MKSCHTVYNTFWALLTKNNRGMTKRKTKKKEMKQMINDFQDYQFKIYCFHKNQSIILLIFSLKDKQTIHEYFDY